MNYSPDEFEALHREIERQGGALLPDICEAENVVFKKPQYIRNKVEKKATCACGNLSRFVSEYDSGDPNEPSHFIAACSVCDNMGDWPRYREVVLAQSEEEDE